MCVSHTIPNKRCHSEVGAPAKQDCRAAQRRHMSRRPRTETSPWYVDPWSPLSPSIPENHSVDERSMRGVCPGFRAGTKLEICHHQCVLCSSLIMPRWRVRRGRGVLCHPSRAACGVTLSHGRMHMDDITFHSEPPSNTPTMVVAFGGWVDAGEAATSALRFLVCQLAATPLATIDPEAFVDFTTLRPIVRLS